MSNSIKCLDCGTMMKLDEIVNKDLQKGNYICMDCATNNFNVSYDPLDTGRHNETPIYNKRLPKLFKFLFGTGLIFILMMTVSLAVCETCPDDIIMYYNLNNLTGGMIELSGNSPDAIDYGSLTETDTFLDGAINKSTADNSQYIDVPNNASFNDLSTGFTISFFYHVGNYGGYGRLISLGDGNIDIYRDNGGSTFVQRTGSLSTNIGLNNGEDWLITIVYTDTQNVTIYKNGSYHAQSIGDAGSLSTANNLRLFKNSGGTSDSSNGIIDEFFIANRPFTSSEVEQLYTDYMNGIRPDFTPELIVTFPALAPFNDTALTGETLLYYNVSIDATCNVSRNGTIIVSDTVISAGTNNFTLPNTVQGYLNLSVSCFAGSSDYVASATYFLDSIDPAINYVNYIQDIDGLNYQLPNSTIDYDGSVNISISDNIMLWSFNLTFGNLSIDDVDYNNYTENLNVKSLDIRDVIDIGIFSEGAENGYLRVCDGHTAKNIRDYDVTAIEGGLDFEGVKIHSDSGIDYIDTVKELDRYNFDMMFDKPLDEFEIEIESDYRKLNIVKDSMYEGHIIVGNNWLDFVNDKFYIYETLNPTIYKVTYKFKSIDGEKYNNVSFDSFGEINCIDYNFTFNVDVDSDTVNLTNLKNGAQYNVTDGSVTINLTYIPYYSPSAPENCTLTLNSLNNVTDFTITKNVQNTFNVYFGGFPSNTYWNYTYNVSCKEAHFHPPTFYETHTKISGTDTFKIYQVSTTTTSTTTTTGESTTTTQGAVSADLSGLNNRFFIMILLIGWVAFMLMTVLIRPYGKTVQFFNIPQMLFGLVLGLNIMPYTLILGFGISFIAVGMFIGLIVYNDL